MSSDTPFNLNANPNAQASNPAAQAQAAAAASVSIEPFKQTTIEGLVEATSAVETITKLPPKGRAASKKAAGTKGGASSLRSRQAPANSPLDTGADTVANSSGARIMQKLMQSAKEASATRENVRQANREAKELLVENKANILDFATGSDTTNIDPEVKQAETTLSSPPDDGIEILCKMAEKGEIDPKNVDIIDVCDKFLKAIASTPKESLRMSGKVIFHAAVLLRLKAEALLSEATNSLNPIVDDFLDFDDDSGVIYDSNKQEVARQLTFKDLEGAIVRRAQRKQAPRERRVTLEELIAALKEAEKLEVVRHEKKPKAPRIDLSGYNEVHDVDDILDLAHDEDIDGTIVRVEQWIAENMQISETIEFVQLVLKATIKHDWVETFLATLFLSNSGKIDLIQDVFYGPLYIAFSQAVQSLNASAAGAKDAAEAASAIDIELKHILEEKAAEAVEEEKKEEKKEEIREENATDSVSSEVE
jgi:segregation and condensation protein A